MRMMKIKKEIMNYRKRKNNKKKIWLYTKILQNHKLLKKMKTDSITTICKTTGIKWIKQLNNSKE